VNNSLAIRAATVDDAVALKRCMISAYSIYEERMSGSPLPPMELDYTEEITSFPTWVATLGGQVIGGLTMMFADILISDGRSMIEMKPVSICARAQAKWGTTRCR